MPGSWGRREHGPAVGSATSTGMQPPRSHGTQRALHISTFSSHDTLGQRIIVLFSQRETDSELRCELPEVAGWQEATWELAGVDRGREGRPQLKAMAPEPLPSLLNRGIWFPRQPPLTHHGHLDIRPPPTPWGALCPNQESGSPERAWKVAGLTTCQETGSMALVSAHHFLQQESGKHGLFTWDFRLFPIFVISSHAALTPLHAWLPACGSFS